MSSLPEGCWRGFVALARIAVVCLLIPVAPAFAQQWSLTVANVDHPGFSLRDTRIVWSGGTAELRVATLRVADNEWHDVRLTCGEAQYADGDLECRKGFLKLAGIERLPMSLRYAGKSGNLRIALEQTPLAALARLMPDVGAWKVGGRIDAMIDLAPQRLAVHAALTDGSFADAAGNHAGEHLVATLDAEAKRTESEPWNWNAAFDWSGGEVFWQPIYLQAEHQTLTARGNFDTDSVRIESAAASLGKVANAAFTLVWRRREKTLERFTIDATEIDLDNLATTVLQPLLDQSALPKVKASGKGRVALEYSDGALQKLDVDVDGAAFAVDDGAADGVNANGNPGRFSLTGINARIPWRRDAPTQAGFSAAGGSLGRLPFGAFALPLRMSGFNFELPKAEIPVLDGKLVLENFVAHHDGKDWHWHLAGALEPVAMPLLTERLGLPRMNGVLSAAIPEIGYADGTLSLGGALIVSVFDGFLSVTGLKVVDPLGKSPRLLAEVEMRHLDLGMLTQTFSFGDITGYIDGDIKGLELVNWRPQRFDAKLISSPGDYRRRISQRAVQNISSLGGAGAAAAIQRSFLSFFETFGYSRIGLSCVLADGICRMGGVEPAPLGYVIVKGGGIPALNVIGYNRQVHWDELLSRLQAVIAGNSRPVIR